jgi:hypothetical protein
MQVLAGIAGMTSTSKATRHYSHCAAGGAPGASGSARIWALGHQLSSRSMQRMDHDGERLRTGAILGPATAACLQATHMSMRSSLCACLAQCPVHLIQLLSGSMALSGAVCTTVGLAFHEPLSRRGAGTHSNV